MDCLELEYDERPVRSLTSVPVTEMYWTGVEVVADGKDNSKGLDS